MTFQEFVYTATWNRQLFQATLADTANVRMIVFNPRNSGVNVTIVSLGVGNTRTNGLPIGIGNSASPIAGINLFSYYQNSNNTSPATSSVAGTNISTGNSSKLVLNTSAAFNPNPAAISFGQGAMDIQINSMVQLYDDIIDPNLQPVILYPGDSFGAKSSFGSSSQMFWQLQFVETPV